MSWRRLEADAPELARLCRARLEGPGVALLGTLRRDGSPRIDPVEPHVVGGELVLGAMRGTAKARALRRDPRCVLHSTVAGPDTGEPDVKLLGRVEASDVLAGWWADRPGDVDVYTLAISEAVVVEWDIPESRMRVQRWTAQQGRSVSERGYP